MVMLLLTLSLVSQAASAPPGRGISEALARERAAAIGALRYDLTFVVPANPRERVQGRATVRFSLKAPHRIVLDFAQPRDRIRSVRANRIEAAFVFGDGHLTIPAESTRAGENDVEIAFVAGDESLNRNDEFLYTLFVPARAHLAFPCFDQPDLKARYTLSLDVPAGWEAIANGSMVQADADADRDRRRIRFAETQPLPTYLFAFTAGKFSVETAVRNGRALRMFHRETDAAKVARNRDAIFDLHASALAWLERYTAIKYPFGKFDVVLIPLLQFIRLEHAGAILCNSSRLLPDESATQNQLLDRASVIAHETSHMWFGDLVTMRWFNDVWMKEVFANFMAAKIVNPSFPQVNHELRFLLSNYPGAYQIDRTAGSNPIRQPLANLDEAGQLYGAIIYQKAPIVMRQLETMIGPQAFRDGMREYLKRYSFGNATWLDLVRILDARTPQDLVAWSRAWVEERGRPEFTTVLQTGADTRLARLALTVRDPLQRGLVWPQRLRVALGYPSGIREVPVTVGSETTEVARATGMPRPLYVLPNGAGLGYGLFVLDDASRKYLLEHLEDIGDPLTRGSAWVTLWENLLDGRVDTGSFIDLVVRALPQERDEQNVQRVLAYTARAFWRYLPRGERMQRATELEPMLRAGLDRAVTSSLKSAWFSTFRDIALTSDGVTWIERIWRRDEKVAGLTLAETDEITMALELAVREVPAWQEILRTQLDRTQNPDRKARFAFVMPALSASPDVREQSFARFRQAENRRREPWVLEAMTYLNHPLRASHAERFIRPSLDLLREIQRTGDIFFPTRWSETALWGHRSQDAAVTVQDFLASELQYPQRLRWTILTAADDVFRASGS